MTREFDNLIASFEAISNYQHKMRYEQFAKYTETSNCLNGFDLTEKCMHSLFSNLDLHKKSYLSVSDWVTAFSKYNYRNNIKSEIADSIKSALNKTSKIYNFVNKKNNICINSFANAVN